MSGNYVQILQERFPQLSIKNAGKNGNLVWNAVQRLETDVLAHEPDYVTIMIGTNDVNCTLSERNRVRYIEFNKLPVPCPDLAWYEENMREMITRIQKRSHPKIALLSLPMIGEDLEHEANERLAPYNATIRKLAAEFFATYIPVNETMVEYLRANQKPDSERASRPKRLAYRTGLININNALAMRTQGLSWNEISQRNGLLLTTDCLHLNDTGAGIVARLVGEWLSRTMAEV